MIVPSHLLHTCSTRFTTGWTSPKTRSSCLGRVNSQPITLDVMCLSLGVLLWRFLRVLLEANWLWLDVGGLGVALGGLVHGNARHAVQQLQRRVSSECHDKFVTDTQERVETHTFCVRWKENRSWDAVSHSLFVRRLPFSYFDGLEVSW